MSVAEQALYQMARVLYRSEVAHSAEMKQSQASLDANAAYRSQESERVSAALAQFGLTVAGKDLVDLGCNDGAITAGYRALRPRHVIGVDIDAKAIARANTLHGSDAMEFRHSTTASLPLETASADVIVSYDVFEHVSDPARILAECRRVLRPGGQMLIGTWGWGHPFAPHLWATMPVPWAHVLVSEASLLAACERVYESDWYQPTYFDRDASGKRIPGRYAHRAISTGYLNKYRVSDFERVFAGSGMAARVQLEPFTSTWAQWTRPLLRVPVVREYLHGYLWAVLTRGGE